MYERGMLYRIAGGSFANGAMCIKPPTTYRAANSYLVLSIRVIPSQISSLLPHAIAESIIGGGYKYVH